ncbi:MAG: methyl-accepting chemotaxis protein [Candidatus Omnitrophica bacterium]|nr:methyl-accepting chemotaxis protein [Candidatus Omnitrophota bacterium]
MTQEMKPKFKRTNYLIAAKLQLKYVGIILLLMFVTALVCSYFVYYTVMIAMGEKLANVYPQGRLMAIINSVNIRMLITFLMLTPIVVIIGVYLSHKIAGPIYRMEKFLGDMALGDLSQRITLRKGDELVTVAEKINALNDSLKLTLGSQKSSMDKIIAELGELKKVMDLRPENTAYLDSNVDKLQAEIKDLEMQLARYKL